MVGMEDFKGDAIVEHIGYKLGKEIRLEKCLKYEVDERDGSVRQRSLMGGIDIAKSVLKRMQKPPIFC